MSRWLSVVIPALNEAESLPKTLDALAGDWPGGPPEIIVVDGGSTDGTREIARRLGAAVLRSPAGRARQMNAGARAATGRFLYFLHADTTPPPNLPLHLRAAAQKDVPACFSIRFDRQNESAWLRLFARLSRLNTDAFRFGDQSLFVSRARFEAVGGFREDHTLLEGHELVKRLGRQAGNFLVMDASVTTSARRYLRHGVLFTQLTYVLIFGLYRLGVRQNSLLRIYRGAFPDQGT